MKIRKTLCHLDRDDIEDNIDEIIELVSQPEYVCRKCARVSKEKDHLCKPLKLEPKK